MKTKGQRQAEDRRRLRGIEKGRDCGPRGKMLGRQMRRRWGDGRVDGAKPQDL